MIHNLNTQCQVIRRVTVNGQRTVVVTDVPEPGFLVQFTPPDGGSSGDGRSPRDDPPYTVRWRAGRFGPVQRPQAGDRALIATASYELLGGTRELWEGPRLVGYEVEVMPVDILYPYEATLTEQTGAVIGTVPVALWESSDEHRDQGEYLNFEGEAPAEHLLAITRNKALNLNGVPHRVTSTMLDASGPRVKFTARVARGT